MWDGKRKRIARSIVLINEVAQSRSRLRSLGESGKISFTYLPSAGTAVVNGLAAG